MIIKAVDRDGSLNLEFSAENDRDRIVLGEIDKRVGSGMKFVVSWTASRPDGTIGALTMEETTDDPME